MNARYNTFFFIIMYTFCIQAMEIDQASTPPREISQGDSSQQGSFDALPDCGITPDKHINPAYLHEAIRLSEGERVQDLFKDGAWLGGFTYPSHETLEDSLPQMRALVAQIIAKLPESNGRDVNIRRLLWALVDNNDSASIAVFVRSLSQEDQKKYLNKQTYNEYTPLETCVRNNNLECFKDLIALGADIDAQPWGCPLIFLAKFFKKADQINLGLEPEIKHQRIIKRQQIIDCLLDFKKKAVKKT